MRAKVDVEAARASSLGPRFRVRRYLTPISPVLDSPSSQLWYWCLSARPPGSDPSLPQAPGSTLNGRCKAPPRRIYEHFPAVPERDCRVSNAGPAGPSNAGRSY